MTQRGEGSEERTAGRRRAGAVVVVLAVAATVAYGWLGRCGDLRDHLPAYLIAHGILVLVMAAAWLATRGAGPRVLRIAVGAALLFRLAAAAGGPALSDDVYRYVWDGRVQAHGIHPYRYAPADPRLRDLRDPAWERINHPELKTIYPPLSQALFLVLAALGAGPTGFLLAMGLLDFAVVLVLSWLLGRLSLPPHRVLWYAWNPVAVLETAGSGHVEPLGVILVLLAAGWIIEGRRNLSTSALGGAVQAKLFPLVLLPGYARRLEARHLALFLLVTVLLAAPYAWTGPAVGAGLFDYAARWQHNAAAFAGIQWAVEAARGGPRLQGAVDAMERAAGGGLLSWDFLRGLLRPDRLARLLAAAAALGWVVFLSFRRKLNAARETFLALAGVLLLSPTLHPWYVLWVLPFAAAYGSVGWLSLAALVPLAYLGGGGDVPWSVRCAEFLPPLALMAWGAFRARRAGR